MTTLTADNPNLLRVSEPKTPGEYFVVRGPLGTFQTLGQGLRDDPYTHTYNDDGPAFIATMTAWAVCVEGRTCFIKCREIGLRKEVLVASEITGVVDKLFKLDTLKTMHWAWLHTAAYSVLHRQRIQNYFSIDWFHNIRVRIEFVEEN